MRRTKKSLRTTVLDFQKFILKQNLQSTFPNIMKLLQILITTWLPTSEAEMCFSTRKCIKRFLRSTVTNQRLTALTMLSIWKTFHLHIWAHARCACLSSDWATTTGRLPGPTRRSRHPIECLAQGHNKQACRLVPHTIPMSWAPSKKVVNIIS